MEFQYLGLVHLKEALRLQAELVQAQRPTLLGFETGPIITLGLRASAEDLLTEPACEVLHVDRGGQATFHNPGQLLIFPILRVVGVRAWVERLSEVTRITLRQWKIESRWQAEQPGLYTAQGKIMACGLRVRNHFSTHGIAINVSNDLAPFSAIRACGQVAARLDRVGSEVSCEDVYSAWVRNFAASHG